MNKIIKNYTKFTFSMAIMGLGISLVTKSRLGTSAISSVPFVLSKVFSLSFGTFTIILNLFYVLIQIIFLNKDFEKEQYLQVLVGPLLGFFIDLWMLIFTNLNPSIYVSKLIVLLIGCIIIGSGVSMQLDANVVNNPMEGVIKLIASKTQIKFSITKIIFDTLLVTLAIIISLFFLGEIVGIREGTLISAFLVGYVIKLISKIREKRFI